ncbi:MAG: hypothetical protein HFJ16_05035 [Romboutsia sp.]|uniref:capsular polysaccharide export protein, LipB/KpsS family n=1 Tax=Romboutsia sp. TaxID=1965302 RepID=UPI00216EEE08|nr:hypothetical protein [Romboutsia sp.]MCI9259589.1 hypothetical protein [Romboutsia sp.]
MNIAVISFYESNSRYYHFLEKEMQIKFPHSNVIQLCLYPSSVKYCKNNNLKYYDITKEVRQENEDTSIDVDRFIDYHIAIMPKYKKEIEKVARQYYSFFKKYFDKNKIDLLICIGEDRLFASIPSYLIKKQNKPVLFFEPGPFGTMIFDDKGVNCNMEISTLSKDIIFNQEIEEDILQEFLCNNSSVKFYDKDRGAYFRKIRDIILSVPPKPLKKRFPIELQTGEGFIESIFYLKKRLIKSKKNYNKNHGRYIFLALQVPTDVQMIKHSPIYNDFYNMINDVYKSMPKGYKLVLREHPMNIGRYDKNIYKLIKENNDIILDNDTNINELIKKAEIIIVNNSTVGVEALKFGKTVITLGKTYYSHVVYELKDKEELKNTINKAINIKIKKGDIDKYLYTLYKVYLIKDHYKNIEYNNLDKLVSKIVKQVEGKK